MSKSIPAGESILADAIKIVLGIEVTEQQLEELERNIDDMRVIEFEEEKARHRSWLEAKAAKKTNAIQAYHDAQTSGDWQPAAEALFALPEVKGVEQGPW